MSVPVNPALCVQQTSPRSTAHRQRQNQPLRLSRGVLFFCVLEFFTVGSYRFFWIFLDKAAAKKRAKKSERAFDQPAVTEALARSGLGGWVPEDAKGRSKFVKQLFAAVCGRSDYQNLSLDQPAFGDMASSLYDEECSAAELKERRRRQAAAALGLFRSDGLHQRASVATPQLQSDRPQVTLAQVELVIAAWQPTARSPSVDATIKADWRSTGQFVSELLNAKRAGTSISITAAQEQLVLASVDASDEASAQWFRCDVGELATKLINDRDDDPCSAAFGIRLLDQLSSRGDPYACIQMATMLVSGELVEPDPRRALALAEKGLLNVSALNMPSSVVEAQRTIGQICCFDPGARDLKRGLAAFKEGAALGDYGCALNLARLLGGKDCEGLRRSHGIERRPDEAACYLVQANEYLDRVSDELDADERRQARDRHRRLMDEIDGASDGASAWEPQP